MLGGLVHAPTPSSRIGSRRCCPASCEHVFFSESGSVAVEVAMKIALQYWRQSRRARAHALRVLSPRLPRRHLRGDVGLRSRRGHAPAVRRRASRSSSCWPLPRRSERAGRAFESAARCARARARRRDRRAARAGRRRHEVPLAGDARARGRVASRAARCSSSTRSRPASAAPARSSRASRRGVAPDIVALGKALTGGMLPLARRSRPRRCSTPSGATTPSHALMHGPTYSGHALACAAANASLDLFEKEPRLAQVAAIDAQLRERARARAARCPVSRRARARRARRRAARTHAATSQRCARASSRTASGCARSATSCIWRRRS